MKLFNKLATVTVASAIVVGSALGNVQSTYASGDGKASNDTPDVSYMGNTENPKNVIFLVGDAWDHLIIQRIVILQIILKQKKWKKLRSINILSAINVQIQLTRKRM